MAASTLQSEVALPVSSLTDAFSLFSKISSSGDLKPTQMISPNLLVSHSFT